MYFFKIPWNTRILQRSRKIEKFQKILKNLRNFQKVRKIFLATSKSLKKKKHTSGQISIVLEDSTRILWTDSSTKSKKSLYKWYFVFAVWERHRPEASDIQTNASSILHRARRRRRRRWSTISRGAPRRPCPEIRKRGDRRAMVVRASGEHDLQPEEQSTVPLAAKRRADSAA